MKNRDELDKWARMMPDRAVIREFLYWMNANPKYCDMAIVDIQFEAALDEYHQINKAKLEAQRRALLDEQRKLIGDYS